jgi:anti-anti-sigma factor
MKTVQIKWLNWVVILHPKGDLLGGDETDELHDAFRSSCAESYQGIVLNLSNVRRINSAAIGVLIGCWVHAGRTGTRTAFCCVPQRGKELLGVFQLRLANTFPTEEEAVRFCSQR